MLELPDMTTRLPVPSTGSLEAKGLAGAVALVSCPTALARIRQPEVALALCRRSLPAAVQAELAGLVLDEVDDLLVTSELDDLEEQLDGALRRAGFPDCPALRGDITLLARQHTAIMGAPSVRLRLDVVETDACRKFHADYVAARTICTYLGRGTQWLAPPLTDVLAADDPPFEEMDSGWVAMFKGRLWLDQRTVLHRSPPISGTGAQRLVLVIDPAPATKEYSA